MEAEITLLHEEKEPGFSVALLQIVATPTYDDVTRLATSLYFKNFIRKWWTVSGTKTDPEDAHIDWGRPSPG